MSIISAQRVVNTVFTELGIDLASYQHADLEWLKEQLTIFLDLEIDIDDLTPGVDGEEEDETFLGDNEQDE